MTAQNNEKPNIVLVFMDQNQQKAKGSSPETIIINDQLDDICAELREEYTNCRIDPNYGTWSTRSLKSRIKTGSK